MDRRIAVMFLFLSLSGCASQTADWYKLPSAYYIGSPAGTGGKTTTTCIDGQTPSCLYYSEDVSGVKDLSLPQADRVRLLDLLMAHSDYNCTTFLNRSLAARNNVGGIRDLLTGLAAIFAHGEPGASVVFSVANLGAGSVSNQFENNVYRGQDFATVHAAIRNHRDKVRREHAAKVKTYSYGQILSAIDEYDAACHTSFAAARVGQ